MYQKIRKIGVLVLMILLLGLVACGDENNNGEGNDTSDKFKIIFRDEDGTILKVEEFAKGEMPIYSEKTPTKEKTAEYTYSFDGWSPELSEVTNNKEYTATYKKEINKYSISFYNEDGTLLQSESLEYGEVPKYNGITPTKESTSEFTYSFSGWSPVITKVDGEKIYIAQFDSEKNEVEVIFVDFDGTELHRSLVKRGSSAIPPKNPTRYGYSFIGWDANFEEVTEPLIIKAIYETSTYTVTWQDYDGVVMYTEVIEHGGDATKPEDPVRDGYLFIGWNEVYTNITRDITIIALYRVSTYNVKWEDYDGTQLKVQTVEHGQNGVAPKDPFREGYIFTGWDVDSSNVIKDLTIVAQYKIQTFVVEFDLDGGIVISGSDYQIVNYGDDAIAPIIEKEGYEVWTWYPLDFTNVKENLTIQATWKKIYNKDVSLEIKDVEFTSNYVEFEVGSNVDTYYFLDNVTVHELSEWYLFEDKHGQNEIITKTVDLNEGYNIFYILVRSESGHNMLYTIEIYKLSLFKVEFQNDYIDDIVSLMFIEEGNLIETIPSAIEKPGHDFIGWDYDFTFAVYENLLIKPVWSPNTYTINFNMNGADDDFDDLEVEYDSFVTLQEPTKIGHIFQGWYRNDVEFESGVWKHDTDLTLKAKWEAKEYMVSFDTTNHDEELEDLIVVFNKVFVLPTLNKRGYDFIGWSHNGNIINDDSWNIAENVTLEMVWKTKTFTIIYDTNGGVLEQHIQEINYNEYTNLLTPVYHGHIFLGWFNNENEIIEDFKWTLEEPLTLIAKWEVLYDYYIENDEIIITNYKEEDSVNVVIPEIIEGKKVVSLTSNSFLNKTSIITIEIPNSIVDIEQGAFYGMINLEKISIPFLGSGRDVYYSTKLGYIFADPNYIGGELSINNYLPNNLKEVIITDQERAINRSLSGSTSIERIEIVNPKTIVSHLLFDGLINLKEIIVPEDSERYKTIDNILYSYQIKGLNEKYTLYHVPEGLIIEELYIIPEVIHTLDWGLKNKHIKRFLVDENNSNFSAVDGVLYSKNLKTLLHYPSGKLDDSYTIIEGAEIIGPYAFNNPIHLQQINIPNSINTIRDSFRGIDNVEYLVIPESVIDYWWGGSFIYDGIFYMEHENIPEEWFKYEKDAKVYLKHEWTYNESGIPVLIN